MIEKNRDILKNALGRMPEHKAGQSDWNHIAEGLTQMEAGAFLSNNLSNLPKHKAPAGAWAGIEKGLAGSFLTGTSGLWIKIGGVSLAGAALISALYFFTPEKNETETTNNPVIEQYQVDETNEPAENVAEVPFNQSNEIGVNSSAEKPKVDNSYPKDTDRNSGSGITAAEDETKKPAGHEASKPRFSNVIDTQNKLNGPARFKHMNPFIPNEFLNSISLSSHSSIPKRVLTKGVKTKDDYAMSRPPTDVYLAATYARLNYHNVSLENMDIPESVSSFGLEVLFERSRFYLKTGVSYLTWQDKANYTFNYNKNELIYSYQYVDSVNFVPSSGQIKYYTTPKDVYDSIAYKQQQNIKNQYRVLQIPVVFGYKLLETKRLTIGLNAGIGADVSIGGKEYIPVFEEEQSQVTGVDNQLVYRPDINWRLIGGVGMYYRLSNNFRLMLEPGYHIYLSPVYEDTEMTGVFYLEFKTGVQFKF